MEHGEHKDMPKERMSPDMCVKMGKCMMREIMSKMEDTPSEEKYKEMSHEEKDMADEKEVMSKED